MAVFTPKTTGLIARNKLRDFAVGATSLDDGIHDGTYTHVFGDHSPRATTGADSTTGASGSGAPTGVTGDTNRIIFDGVIGGCPSDAFVMGTQTILAPVRHATLGIAIGQDVTNADGMQYVFGGNTAYNRFGHTVGTTADSFIKLTLLCSAATGTDNLYVGWVKQTAFNATFTTYTDYALLGNVTAAAKVSENIGGAGAVTSASLGTITSAVAFTVEIRVTKAGRATYLFNNAVVNPGTTYTFTNGLFLVPFLHFLNNATTTSLYLQRLQIGRRRSVNTDKASNDQ